MAKCFKGRGQLVEWVNDSKEDIPACTPVLVDNGCTVYLVTKTKIKAGEKGVLYRGGEFRFEKTDPNLPMLQFEKAAFDGVGVIPGGAPVLGEVTEDSPAGQSEVCVFIGASHMVSGA